jgi:hypothetical protein
MVLEACSGAKTVQRAQNEGTSDYQRLPARSGIDEHAPLRLAVAAAIAYPDGSMKASGLRREHAKGRLVIERTAGKDYTTIAARRL